MTIMVKISRDDDSTLPAKIQVIGFPETENERVAAEYDLPLKGESVVVAIWSDQAIKVKE